MIMNECHDFQNSHIKRKIYCLKNSLMHNTIYLKLDNDVNLQLLYIQFYFIAAPISAAIANWLATVFRLQV